MTIWGLPYEDSLSLKVLLVILRLPGMAVLDAWVEGKDVEWLGLDESAWIFLFLLFVPLLLLPMEDLVRLYLYLIRTAVLVFCKYVVGLYVTQERLIMLAKLQNIELASREVIASHLVVALLILSAFSFLVERIRGQSGASAVLSPGLFLLPLICRMMGFNIAITQKASQLANWSFLITIIADVNSFFSPVYNYVMEVKLLYSMIGAEIGWHNVAVMLLLRIFEPVVMGSYWLLSLIHQICSSYFMWNENVYIAKDEAWYFQILVDISEICNSFVMLIAFCLVIMYFSKLVLGLLSQMLSVCSGTVNDHNPPSGFPEGMVTFVLALQTELIDLEMPQRVGATTVIIFVVFSSFIQSMFEMTSPVLLSLPAINRKLYKHIPVLLVIIVLLAFPILVLVGIYTSISHDLWMLVVISSYLVTSIQILGCIASYLLLMWDVKQETPCERMTDYIFYIKSTTKAMEVLMAVLIVIGGVMELLYSEDTISTFSLSILSVHFYINVYLRIQGGWKTYMARREAHRKMDELPDATKEELESHGDVCSICYQEMNSAKKTVCLHYFHGSCLKRWLFVQDKCPMCQAPIVKTEKSNAEAEEQETAEGQPEEPPAAEPVPPADSNGATLTPPSSSHKDQSHFATMSDVSAQPANQELSSQSVADEGQESRFDSNDFDVDVVRRRRLLRFDND